MLRQRIRRGRTPDMGGLAVRSANPLFLFYGRQRHIVDGTLFCRQLLYVFGFAGRLP
jgi:hypothetical protein